MTATTGTYLTALTGTHFTATGGILLSATSGILWPLLSIDTKRTNGGIKTNVNSTANIVKNTVLGVTVGAVTTKVKVDIASRTSANKAVQGARSIAHSQGKGLSTNQAKAIATKTRVHNIEAKNTNKTIENNANKALGSSASEVSKRKTDEERSK